MYGGLAALFVTAIGFFDAHPTTLDGVLGWGGILSAFLIGRWSWDWLVEGGGSHPFVRAGVSGLLTGTLSHISMWLMAGIWSLTQSGPLVSVWFGGAFLSLLFLGWATAGLAIVGALLLASIRILVSAAE